MKIKLTESKLKQIVTESVRTVLNELGGKGSRGSKVNLDYGRSKIDDSQIDYSKHAMYNTPRFKDYRHRQNWWKEQLDNEFPNHNIKNSDNWEREYNTMFYERGKQDLKNKTKETKKDTILNTINTVLNRKHQYTICLCDRMRSNKSYEDLDVVDIKMTNGNVVGTAILNSQKKPIKFKIRYTITYDDRNNFMVWDFEVDDIEEKLFYLGRYIDFNETQDINESSITEALNDEYKYNV